MGSSARKIATAGAPWVIACGALTLGTAGAVMDDRGGPSQQFEKDLIRAGDWYKASTGQRFKLTRADLDRYVATFDKMSQRGVKVPVPAGHTNDPEANRGYVRAMWRDGDVLMGRIELIGKDAIELAARTEVSICVEEELTAGDGTKFVEPITHVALVTDPVINGQGPFVKIAASRGSTQTKDVPVYRLSQEDSSMEALKKIAAAHGIDPGDMDESKLTEAILAKVKANDDAMKASAEKAKEGEKALTTSRSEVETLKLNKGLPVADPDALEQSAKFVTLSLDNLQTAGKIGTVSRKALETLLLGDAANRPGLMLSKKVANAAGLPVPLAETILDIFKTNDPVVTGGKTGPQSLVLGRNTPGGDPPASKDPNLAERSKIAYGR